MQASRGMFTPSFHTTIFAPVFPQSFPILIGFPVSPLLWFAFPRHVPYILCFLPLFYNLNDLFKSTPTGRPLLRDLLVRCLMNCAEDHSFPLRCLPTMGHFTVPGGFIPQPHAPQLHRPSPSPPPEPPCHTLLLLVTMTYLVSEVHF
jgi:hypothetical protein